MVSAGFELMIVARLANTPSTVGAKASPAHSKGKHMGTSGWTYVVFLRWMHQRMRDDEIQRVFVRALGLGHLPNTDRAPNIIAERQGIKPGEIPSVNYVDLRDGERSR